MGLIAVAPHQIATVVTSLEMLKRPTPRPLETSPLRLVAWEKPTSDKYRLLFKRIGAPWLWFSRLVMNDTTLEVIIHDAGIKIWAVVDPKGVEVGILELDFRQPGICELSFLGLVPELAGQGFGRWLMAHALMQAWRKDVSKVWVHTCTLDHPTALRFYQKSGFVPFARAVDTFDDPRLIGILPKDVAPHIPLLEGGS